MKRVQMRRGVALPPNTKYVGRPTQWGNPWRVGINRDQPRGLTAARVLGLPTRLRPPSRGQRHSTTIEPITLTQAQAVMVFRVSARETLHYWPDWLEPLRGYDLACYCEPDEPCHADVLLDLIAETQADAA